MNSCATLGLSTLSASSFHVFKPRWSSALEDECSLSLLSQERHEKAIDKNQLTDNLLVTVQPRAVFLNVSG